MFSIFKRKAVNKKVDNWSTQDYENAKAQLQQLTAKAWEKRSMDEDILVEKLSRKIKDYEELM